MVRERASKTSGECPLVGEPYVLKVGTFSCWIIAGHQLPDVSQKRKLAVVDILEGFMFQVICCRFVNKRPWQFSSWGSRLLVENWTSPEGIPLAM